MPQELPSAARSQLSGRPLAGTANGEHGRFVLGLERRELPGFAVQQFADDSRPRFALLSGKHSVFRSLRPAAGRAQTQGDLAQAMS